MRLKELKIHEYKNLKDLKVTFDDDNYVDILVGKNGSGKSNFFEALLKILGKMINDFNNIIDSEIQFELTYEINGRLSNFKFNWDEQNILIKEADGIDSIENTIMVPDNLIVYYSGHNSNIKKIIDGFDETLKRKTRVNKSQEERKILGITPDYRELLLTLIIIQDDENIAKKLILKKLGIKKLGKEIKLVITPPNYARRNQKQYEIKTADEKDYWKIGKRHQDFLRRISLLSDYNSSKIKMTRDEGYNFTTKQYVYHCYIESFNNEFKEYSLYELFHEFDKLKILGMLGQVSIDVELENGFQATVSTFSDGQFQSVYIYALTEIFKGKDCVTLLDEPDSFLHPEWQAEFLKQVTDISEDSLKSNHIIMTSHSAATISQSENKNLGMFVFEDGKVKIEKHPIGEIIKSLSAGLMSYSEIDSLISLTKALKSESRAVLFVEGVTDVLILEKAYDVLYKGKKDIDIVTGYDCKGIRRILTEKYISDSCPNKYFYGLFDFDNAWGEYNGLKSANKEEHGNCVSGLYKKVSDTKCYGMMLPIPDKHPLKCQVINDNGTHWRMNSNFTIEHYFYGKVEDKYFKTDETNPSNHIVFCSDKQKYKFAKDIVSELPDSAFEDLRPIFENIYNIMQQENKNEVGNA